MSIKETFEQHAVPFILGAILGAFAAGWGAREALLQAQGGDPSDLRQQVADLTNQLTRTRSIDVRILRLEKRRADLNEEMLVFKSAEAEYNGQYQAAISTCKSNGKTADECTAAIAVMPSIERLSSQGMSKRREIESVDSQLVELQRKL